MLLVTLAKPKSTPFPVPTHTIVVTVQPTRPVVNVSQIHDWFDWLSSVAVPSIIGLATLAVAYRTFRLSRTIARKDEEERAAAKRRARLAIRPDFNSWFTDELYRPYIGDTATLHTFMARQADLTTNFEIVNDTVASKLKMWLTGQLDWCRGLGVPRYGDFDIEVAGRNLISA